MSKEDADNPEGSGPAASPSAATAGLRRGTVALAVLAGSAFLLGALEQSSMEAFSHRLTSGELKVNEAAALKESLQKVRMATAILMASGIGIALAALHFRSQPQRCLIAAAAVCLVTLGTRAWILPDLTMTALTLTAVTGVLIIAWRSMQPSVQADSSSRSR